MAKDKDLETEGTEDRIEGAGNQVGGRVRNAVGGLTGDSSEQVKGKAQELKGKIQDAVGKEKQRADRDLREDEV